MQKARLRRRTAKGEPMSAQTPAGPTPRITAASLRAMKEARRPIVMLTAYDYHSARLVDAAGVDAVLVGDSLGMTVLGHESTLSVTVDDIAPGDLGGVACGLQRARDRRHAVHVLPGRLRRRHAQRRPHALGRRGARRQARRRIVRHPRARRRARLGRRPGHGPCRAHAAVGQRPRRLSHSGQGRAGRRPGHRRCRRARCRGCLRDRARVRPCRARRAHQRARDHPHHRDRCGCGLRRPGPGLPRPARPGGVPPTPREALRRTRRRRSIAPCPPTPKRSASGAFPGEDQSTHMDGAVLAEAEILYAAEYGDEFDGDLA